MLRKDPEIEGGHAADRRDRVESYFSRHSRREDPTSICLDNGYDLPSLIGPATRPRVKLSAVKRQFVILAMLLLAWAQCFGVGLRFICLCPGIPVVTSADHCHGPHGSDCVGVHHHVAEEEHGCADDEPGTEQHASLSEDLQLPTAGKSASAPEYIAMLVAVLPDLLELESLTTTLLTCDAVGPPPDTSPPGIRLSHTVALLI